MYDQFEAPNDFRCYILHSYEQNFLAHHGILGMKWGVRNGPPYPLDAKTSKKVKSGDKSDQRIGVIPPFISPYLAAAAIGILSRAVLYQVPKQIYKNVRKHQGKQATKNSEELFNQSKTDIKQSDLKEVNPNYPKKGYTQNCPSCALSLELKKRGENYEATKMKRGLKFSEISQTYKNAKESNTQYVKNSLSAQSRSEALSDAFKKMNQKSGSHGYVIIQYNNGGGGHILNYTVTKNGQIRYEDGQPGYSFNQGDFSKFYPFSSFKVVDMTNAKINWNNVNENNLVIKK